MIKYYQYRAGERRINVAGKKVSPKITKEEASKLPDYLVEMINKGQIKYEKEGNEPARRTAIPWPKAKFAVGRYGTVGGKMM